MSFEIIRNSFPGIAASNITGRSAVTLASGLNRGVAPVSTNNIALHGLTPPVNASQGDPVTVYDRNNYVKVQAAASIGPDSEVGVVGATTSLGPVVGASGLVKHSVGQSVEGAAAGEFFSVFVNPRQLSGLV